MNTTSAVLSYCGLVDARISASEKDLPVLHCTEVHFSSFFSGGYITAIVVNPLKAK